jgi:hypothetical protein
MEIPNLSLSSILNLDSKISVIRNVEISICSQLRNNIEISLNIEAKVSVKLSLGWFVWILVSIDYLPLLVDSVVLIVDLDVLVLIVNTSRDFHDLLSIVHNVSSLQSKQLPPS